MQRIEEDDPGLVERLPRDQRALRTRFTLVRPSGEAGLAATASIALDVKRTYLELRPHLRRVCLESDDVAAHLPWLAPLGFADAGITVALDGVEHHTLNDFGPASVDGWLSDVVVSALRKKLGEQAGALETVRGVGYRLRPLT